MHKTHLLCLFAHGIYVNTVLANEQLLNSAQSLIPKNYFTPKRFNLDHLEKFVSWFNKCIRLKKDIDHSKLNADLHDRLKSILNSKVAESNIDHVLTFVLIARSIGMDTRLVLNFHPISWKPSAEALMKKKNSDLDDGNKCHTKEKNSVSEKAINSTAVTKNKKDTNIKHTKKNKGTKKELEKKKSDKNARESDCEDFSEDSIKFRDRSNSSSENDVTGFKKKSSIVAWSEIFVEEEEKWIAIDVLRSKIHCATEIQVK